MLSGRSAWRLPPPAAGVHVPGPRGNPGARGRSAVIRESLEVLKASLGRDGEHRKGSLTIVALVALHQQCHYVSA